MAQPSISEQLFPGLRGCFGCDPDHPHGLRLRGRAESGAIVADWEPDGRYESWPGIVHGGILSTVLDELTGWAAALAFRERDGHDERPIVTAEFSVRYHAPAESGRPIRAEARVSEHLEEQAIVEAVLRAGETRLASCSARYVRLRAVPDWLAR